MIGEALDPSRNPTEDFYPREPQRGDIVWVMQRDVRMHIGMVVGCADANGIGMAAGRDDANGTQMVGIAGLNGSSNLAALGFRWGPKIELHPLAKCRAYSLEDVAAHFKAFCRGLEAPQ